MNDVLIHASAVLAGAMGVLIRGVSGSGKSTLATDLMRRLDVGGRFTRLVADDQVYLEAAHGRVIARPPPALAGMIEMRGFGICNEPYEPSAVIRLAVDLVESSCVPRMPDRAEIILHEETHPIRHLQVPGKSRLSAGLVIAALDELDNCRAKM